MVFTKYVSLCLVSPQLGFGPVVLVNIFDTDTKKYIVFMFLIIPKIMSVGVCRSRAVRNEVHSSKFHWCIISAEPKADKTTQLGLPQVW